MSDLLKWCIVLLVASAICLLIQFYSGGVL